MEIKNKVAHLKGLMEGMEFDTATKEGKIIAEIVEILCDTSEELEMANDDIEALYEYADELDSDLGDVESELYGDDYCDCDDEDDDWGMCEDCEEDDCSSCPALSDEE